MDWNETEQNRNAIENSNSFFVKIIKSEQYQSLDLN